MTTEEAVVLPPPSITKEYLESLVVHEEYAVFGGRMTICVLTLKNGFMAYGESSCVHPKTFNKELGEKYAREKAIDQLWLVEGYRLRDQLHNDGLLG